MTDRESYYRHAESWATDTRVAAAQSRRIAWTIGGIAVAVAAFEAVALAMLVPLKTVQPVTLLVDRQTGYVQSLDPASPQRVKADNALTDAYLAQYVIAREGFDRTTVQLDYRKVGLWSTGRARSTYLSSMAAASAVSPFQVYPAGTVITAMIKSVSRLSPGLSLVRFDTQRQNRDGQFEAPRPWISVVRYRYSDAPMSLQDRLVNPLGFQVTGYRRDAEAPPPLVPTPTAVPVVAAKDDVPSSVPAGITRTVERSTSTVREVVAPVSRPMRRSVPVERREVPVSNIPLGSPLGSATSLASAAGSKQP
jgi:type IV secretion system protein VirB8